MKIKTYEFLFIDAKTDYRFSVAMKAVNKREAEKRARVLAKGYMKNPVLVRHDG